MCEHYFRKESDRAHHKYFTDNNLLISSLVQSSARSATAGLGIGEDLLCTNAGPLTYPSSLNLSQSNLLFVLIVTGVLDGLETSSDTNFYLRDQSLFVNSMALYNVNTVNDG